MKNVTIFDLLQIEPIDEILYFIDGRFYAYHNILIDLHTQNILELKQPTQYNGLFKQLNINRFHQETIISSKITGHKLTFHYNNHIYNYIEGTNKYMIEKTKHNPNTTAVEILSQHIYNL